MKRICMLTMARNDNFFLEKWMRYYGEQIGYENLYIFLDGLDSDVPNDPTGKVYITPREKIAGTLNHTETPKFAFLSDQAEILFKEYDIVIGCDADEYIVVEPALGMTLGEYLSSIKIRNTVSGLGFDVAQNEKEEKPYDPSRPILQQRSYAILNPDYTKPCVMTHPMRWGVGYHRIRGYNYHIDKNLYMFHFGCFDAEMQKEKMKSSDLCGLGWEHHLQFRRKAIDDVTNCSRVLNGEKFLPIARFIQKWFRPIYKWNRPSMLGRTVVVTIPERFKSLL